MKHNQPQSDDAVKQEQGEDEPNVVTQSVSANNSRLSGRYQLPSAIVIVAQFAASVWFYRK